MGIRYAGEGDDNKHGEAFHLISEHCVDGYVETRRNDGNLVSFIFASCLHADGSPPV